MSLLYLPPVTAEAANSADSPHHRPPARKTPLAAMDPSASIWSVPACASICGRRGQHPRHTHAHAPDTGVMASSYVRGLNNAARQGRIFTLTMGQEHLRTGTYSATHGRICLENRAKPFLGTPSGHSILYLRPCTHPRRLVASTCCKYFPLTRPHPSYPRRQPCRNRILYIPLRRPK